jgi:hypothetical protein
MLWCSICLPHFNIVSEFIINLFVVFFWDLSYLDHPMLIIPRSSLFSLDCVRSLTLARNMTQISFIKIVQTSTLKLAFVVEYKPVKS